MSYGLSSEAERIKSTITSMYSIITLVLKNPKDYCFFMHLLGVIRFLFSPIADEILHEQRGIVSMRSLTLS